MGIWIDKPPCRQIDKYEALDRLREAGLPMGDVLKALDGLPEYDYYGTLKTYGQRVRDLEDENRFLKAMLRAREGY